MKRTIIAFIFWIPFLTYSQIINIPSDYPTIQQGIDAAIMGDTVLVDTGTYYENIKYEGKAITVASQFIIDGNTNHITNTIIDGSQPIHPDTAAVVMFLNGEDTTSILCGFTITGGMGLLNYTWQIRMGGGIACFNAGAKIIDNKIIDNVVSDPSLNCGGSGVGSFMDAGEYWLIVHDNLISNNQTSANALNSSGSIYSSTNTIITNNIIEGNTCINSGTQADGGGIHVQQISTAQIEVNIYNNIINDNTLEANYAYGAGVNIYMASSTISSNTIQNNSINANNGCRGGGIYIRSTEMVNVWSNEILNNTVEAIDYAQGAGIQFWDTEGKATLKDNNISDNIIFTTNSYRGSGVNFKGAIGQIDILNNYISGNIGPSGISNGAGGGICIRGAGETEIKVNGNQFINNISHFGGGFFESESQNFLLTNNIFIGNSAENGGGIALTHTTKGLHSGTIKASTPPRIINNTFYGNSANDKGGAIRLDGDANIPIVFNSIFWENNASDGKDIHTGTANMTISYSDFDPDNISGSWNGEYNINEDPNFIDTLYHLHNCASPCINAGINALEVGGTWYNSPTDDIDKENRPYQNTLPDIGADETSCLEIFIEAHHNRITPFSQLIIYPNPSSTQITIELPTQPSKTTTLTISNTNGQQLITQPITEPQTEIDISHLPAGIYIVKVWNDKDVMVQKVIKK